MVLNQVIVELEQDKKNIIKDMKQNEILNEKEMYKINAKLKEYKYIIHEQKKTILELDQDIQNLKSEQLLKEQMVRKGQEDLLPKPTV